MYENESRWNLRETPISTPGAKVFVVGGLLCSPLLAGLVFTKSFHIGNPTPTYSIILIALGVVGTSALIGLFCGLAVVPFLAKVVWLVAAVPLDAALRVSSSTHSSRGCPSATGQQLPVHPDSGAGVNRLLLSPDSPRVFVEEPPADLMDLYRAQLEKSHASTAVIEDVYRRQNPGCFWLAYRSDLPSSYQVLDLPGTARRLRHAYRLLAVAAWIIAIAAVVPLVLYLLRGSKQEYTRLSQEATFLERIPGAGFATIGNDLIQNWLTRYCWILLWLGLFIILVGVAVALKRTRRSAISRLTSSIAPGLKPLDVLSTHALTRLASAPPLLYEPPRLHVPSRPEAYVRSRWTTRLATCPSCAGRGTVTRTYTTTRLIKTTSQGPNDFYPMGPRSEEVEETRTYQAQCGACRGRGTHEVARAEDELLALCELVTRLKRDAVKCAKAREQIEVGLKVRNTAILWRTEKAAAWSRGNRCRLRSSALAGYPGLARLGFSDFFWPILRSLPVRSPSCFRTIWSRNSRSIGWG